MIKQKNLWTYVGLYTIVFAITFCVVYAPILIDDRSFIWVADGRTQLFPTLVYVGRYIRRLVANLFHGKLAVPLFDLSIGNGGDVLSFPSAMGMLDPFILILSPLTLTKYSDSLYSFLTVFYLYLAGLSFSYLCGTFKKERLSILIGSIVYCFSGWVIIREARSLHFFTMGMIQLPLLIVGAYRIMKGGKPWLFVLVVFWTTINKFYTLYMVAIMVAVFVLVIFLCDHETKQPFKETIQQLVVCAGRIFLYALLGMGLAGIILIPATAGIFESSRSGGLVYNDQPWTWYRNAALRLFAKAGEEDIAIAALVFPAVICLFTSKMRSGIKVLTVITTLGYFSTFVCWVLMGFQYVSRRWIFGAALVWSYVVVEMLPELLRLNKKRLSICYAFFFIYAMFVIGCTILGVGAFALIGVAFIGLTLSALTLGDYPVKPTSWFRKIGVKNIQVLIILGVVICNVVTISCILNSPYHDKLAGEFKKTGSELNRLESAAERHLEPYLLHNPRGRGDGTNFYRNVGMVWQIPTVYMAYNSLENGKTIDFWNAIRLSTRNQIYNHYSTDHRTIPLTLLSNKYYVANSEKDRSIPYGYTKLKTKKDGLNIYENKYALPWGYTYDSVVSYDYLESLNALEKQEAMLQSIALENTQSTGSKQSEFSLKKLPYEIAYKGCSWKNGILRVKQTNAVMTIKFEAKLNEENYLHLKNFDLSNVRAFNMAVKCSGMGGSTAKTSNDFARYRGIKDYYYNLGSKNSGKTSLTISIRQKGNYKLGGIVIYSTAFDDYVKKVESLKKEPLKNIKWDTNSLSGTVDLSKDKVLCVSVPYSKGWSATVDGKKADILLGNYMFMALPLKAGHHDIKFSYCTPGLKLGAGLSALCFSLLVGMFIRDRRYTQKKN